MTTENLLPVPELYAPFDAAESLKMEATELVSWDLTQRQTCDLELLMNGGFYPLTGFLGQKDYDSVVKDMRLADGSLWPMPINLDVPAEFAENLAIGQKIALRDQEGVILATLDLSDIYTPDKAVEAENVFGADDVAHPAVNYLHNTAGDVYLGGKVTGIQPVVHYDFRARRDSPNEMRSFFRKMGWRRSCCIPNPQPIAPRAPRINIPRRQRGTGKPIDPPSCGHGQTGRHRSLYTRTLLRSCFGSISSIHDINVIAEPCHAYGWPTRGRLARFDP